MLLLRGFRGLLLVVPSSSATVSAILFCTLKAFSIVLSKFLLTMFELFDLNWLFLWLVMILVSGDLRGRGLYVPFCRTGVGEKDN